jgi:hypothetical protein
VTPARAVRALVGLGLGVATVPLVTLLVMAGERSLTLFEDFPPAGPACDHESSTGSGLGGRGVERIDRFPPERICVDRSGTGTEQRHTPVAWSFLDWARPLVAVLVGLGVGCLAGGAVAMLVIEGRRRRASSQVSGLESPT